MAGIVGVGSLSERRRRDPRDRCLVSDSEIWEAVHRGLPSPPPGSSWEWSEGGDWVLVEAATRHAPEAPQSEAPPVAAQREHVILPGDTLQGICLKYKIKPRDLKRANPQVDVRDSTLRGLSVLVIPGDGPCQPRSLEVDVARFRTACPSLGSREARYYLSEADGDFDDAVARAREDTAWEIVASSSKAKAPPPTAAKAAPSLPVATARCEPADVARAVPVASEAVVAEPLVTAEVAAPSPEATTVDSVLSFFFDVGDYL